MQSYRAYNPARMPLPPGTRLGPYEVTALIGAGGMGEVYRALDTRLNRPVAIKVLLPDHAADAERRRRFEQEARTISGLDHPHICPLFDLGRESGIDYLVMPLLDGETLAKRIERAAGPLPLREALTIATQIVDGLARAHALGIVHRDLKPANVMLTKDGVRLLDFGIARRAQPAVESTVAGTRPGLLVGTVGYMSPEQVQGAVVGPASDLFSVGVVLYEMVTGRRPFIGENEFSTMTAIVSQEPPPLAAVQPPVPPEVARLIAGCLEKDPAARPPSAEAFLSELRKLTSETAHVVRRIHPAVAATIALIVVALVGSSAWLWYRNARITRARTQLIPEITRLAETDTFRALKVFKEADGIVPGDPQLASLRSFVSSRVKVESEPAGARAFIAPYGADGAWEEIGTTPFEYVAPFGESRWKFAKDGYAAVEMGQALQREQIVHAKLHGLAEVPDGMIFVPGGEHVYRSGQTVQLDAYWLDRYEVSNRQFKAFVDAGGYRRPDMQRFTDTTARPGPAGWELGSFPAGTTDHPVSGISWFEARAYCESVGKTLPTVHHWFKASGTGNLTRILQKSNFGAAPAPVGTHGGLGPFGTYDMAGNVKEWASNADGDLRYILGGAWSEPAYLFHDHDARPAAERTPTHGVRCARYAAPPAAALLAPIGAPFAHDYSKRPPVPPQVVDAYLRQFDYDKLPLDTRTEGETPHDAWRIQRISIMSPAGERMPIRVYLPSRGKPPYQTVIFFPGSYMFEMSNPAAFIDEWFFDFIMRSGRAVVYPTYEGAYERRIAGVRRGTNQWKEIRMMWPKEVRRTVDYLETRPDVDVSRVAYYGVSMGASFGPIMLAAEPRIRAAILAAGGFSPSDPPGEINSFSYAPRVKMPVLMLNTRDDFLFPYETSQRPMFTTLGTPAEQKLHVVQDVGGHSPRRTDIARHILDWLDRWFGTIE